jgi:hypothetical protein
LRKIGQGILPSVLYGAKKMNMISTGAFHNEMSASDKKNKSLVGELVTAWEQKNSKAARAGGVSLMALSLAACGSSDDTSDAVSYTQAQLDAAKLAATAAAEASAEAAAVTAAATASTAQAAAVTSAEAAAATAATAAKVTADAAQTAAVAAAVAAVDTSSDDAAAVSLALRNAAAEAGATTFDGMSDAAMISAITSSDNAGIADAAVAALGLSGISSLAALNTAYTAAIAPSAKTSYAFTTTTDNLTHSTSANATFSGVLQANGATGTTIAPGDVVTGGSGTGDAVSVAVAGALTAGYTLSAVQTVGVEKFLVSNFDTHTTNNNTIDASLFDSSMATVGLSSSSAAGDTIFSGMKALMGAEMRNGSADLTVTYNASVVSGSADSQALVLSNNTGGTFTSAGVETVAITSELASNTLAALTAANATKVTIDGSANFTLTGASTIKALDASAATGNVSLTLGAAVHTVTGGSGADTIDSGTTLASTDTLTGGNGSDTLIISAAGTINKGTAAAKGELYNVSGFETVDIASTNDAATLDMTGVADVTTVKAAANTFTVALDANASDTAKATDSAAIVFTLNGTSLTTAAQDGSATSGEAATLIKTQIDAQSGFSAAVTGASIAITNTGSETIEFALSSGHTAEDSKAYNDLTVSNLAASGTSLDIYSGDAVTASLADASGTSDSLNVNLKTVSADNGVTKTVATTLTANNIETINLDNSGMDNGIVTTVSTLTGNLMKTLNITGDSDTTIGAFTGSTALTTISAGTMTGDVSLAAAPAAKDQTITTGSGNDTITMAALLTEADVIDGGANNIPLSGTTNGSDTLTASGNIGTVTDVSTLQIANVEAINITNTGAAATYIDASKITGTSTVAFSAASGTVKLTNLGTNHTIGAGLALDEFDGTLNLAMADATGSTDAVSVAFGTSDATSTTALTIGSAVETTNLIATEESANDETTNVTSTNLASKNIVITKGHSGDTLALGTLNAATTNVDASAYAGILSLTTAATGAVTVSSIGSTLQSIVTGAGNDTVTLSGKSAANAHTLTGNGGTADVLNITLDNAASDFTNVSGFETINMTVGGNAQAGIDDATKDDGLNAASTINLTGGDSLSTFTVGTAGLIDANTAAYKFDASSFGGKIDLLLAEDAFNSFLTVKGGASTTDTIRIDAEDTANKVASMTGVETVIINTTDSDTDAVVDLTNVTGATKATVAFTTSTNADTITVSGVAAGLAMTTTSTQTADNLVVNLASATGASDALALEITSVVSANDVFNLDAAGVETLTLTAKNSTNAVALDVAGVTATSGSTVSINASGAGAVTFNAINTGTTTIDGSAMTGALTVDAAQRGNGVMTIKGGTAGDAIEMENAADVLSGGLGTDSLNITHTGILGGIAVNLSATDQVSTFDTVANSTVQSGFENLDVSGYTNFGASIIGSSGANNVVGTASIDSITGGLGADTVRAGAGADVISFTETTEAQDTIILDTAASTDTVTGFTLGTGKDVIQFDDSDLALFSLDGDAITGAVAGVAVAGDVTAAIDLSGLSGAQNILVLSGTHASEQALYDLLEDGGTGEIKLDSTAINTEKLNIAYVDTAGNTNVGYLTITRDGTDTDALVDSTETITILATFSGSTGFHVDNFDIIA